MEIKCITRSLVIIQSREYTKWDKLKDNDLNIDF